MKFTLGASWLPKLGGIGAILTAFGSVCASLSHGAPIAWETILPSVSAGFGLLFARQNNKTSEDVGVTPKPIEPPKP